MSSLASNEVFRILILASSFLGVPYITNALDFVLSSWGPTQLSTMNPVLSLFVGLVIMFVAIYFGVRKV